ncbi:MAG: hypothetical protein J0G96_02530 [Flavobacteriia bacterium]|nr:hypothetical protein [Flavobacteriia bacterium]OJX37523.1 MAG: hypothetical protein BGO87_00750 [Flavobacteriia bacterium 40-80]
MSDRQDIQDFINQYIVSNSKQWITGEKMNIILNDFASKIKFFKDENSVEKMNFNGVNNFIREYNSHLDSDLTFYDPLYFSNLTLNDAKTIIQIRSTETLSETIARQPEIGMDLIAYFEQTKPVNITSSYTRGCYIFYASKVMDGIARQPEAGSMLISYYQNIISSPITVIQTPFEQVCRLMLVAETMRATARQPELMKTFQRFLLYFGKINQLDHPMVNVARNYAVGVLLECIARQPELTNMLKEFFIIYAGNKIVFKTIEYQYSEAAIMAAFYESAGRQPELLPTMVNAINELTNLTLNPLA